MRLIRVPQNYDNEANQSDGCINSFVIAWKLLKEIRPSLHCIVTNSSTLYKHYKVTR